MSYTPSGEIIQASDPSGPPVDWIPLSIGSSDIDLTAPLGPTKGFYAKGLFVGTAGIVYFYCTGLPAPGQTPQLRSVTVPNNSIIPGKILCVGGSTTGTTASNIQALM